jgi:hypothetical protein
VVRRTRLITGPLLIVLGLALVPLMDGSWRPQDLKPADVHVSIFSEKTQAQFRASHSGYYSILFIVSQSKPFKDVYCLLRSPYDYWSSVACDKTVKFSDDWTLSENDIVVQQRRGGRASAGITAYSEAGNRYLKRLLGTVYLESGHFYTLTLTLDGSDIALSEVNPRLQLQLEQNAVEMRGWRALWAMLTAPLCIFGGLWLFIKGLKAKLPAKKRPLPRN